MKVKMDKYINNFTFTHPRARISLDQNGDEVVVRSAEVAKNTLRSQPSRGPVNTSHERNSLILLFYGVLLRSILSMHLSCSLIECGVVVLDLQYSTIRPMRLRRKDLHRS